MHKRTSVLTVLALLLAVFSLMGPVAAQDTETFTSDDGLFSASYPAGWTVIVDDAVIIGSSSAAIDASDNAEPLPTGEIVYSIILPELLPQIGLTTTSDPTTTLETLITVGEFAGTVSSYNDTAVPAAHAIVKDAATGLGGEMIALGFDSGTVVVLVEVGGATGSQAAEVDAFIASIRYDGQSASGAATATEATELRQWASFATGTSQYGETSWNFGQATGAPDTFDCGDIVTAWASATSTGTDMLALEFAEAVHPTEVNIYQTYNPGSITRVELTNTTTGTVTAVPDSADPPGNTPCPGVFSLDVSSVDVGEVDGVIIYVDQSIGGSWNEIDAVELVGTTGDAAVETSAGVPNVDSLSFITTTLDGFTFSYPDTWTLDQDGGTPIIASDPAAVDLTNGDDLPAGAIRIEFALPEMLDSMGLPAIGPARDAVTMVQGMLGTTGEIEDLTGLNYSGVLTHAEPGPNVPEGAVMIGLETAEGTVLMAIRTEQFDDYRPIIDAIINSIEYDL